MRLIPFALEYRNPRVRGIVNVQRDLPMIEDGCMSWDPGR